jgi:hypothetical protein
MADKNLISRREITGSNRITPVELLDMVGSDETPINVMITNQRNVSNISEDTYLKDANQRDRNSPWQNDRLGKAFTNQALTTRKLKDPAEYMKEFLRSLEQI